MKTRVTKRKMTLVDVAAAADVSPITVSRALRDPNAVSPERRARILRAVAELGYVPDPAASALASKRSNVVGVLIPSITNNVFADVLRGIYASVGTFDIQLGNTHYSPLEEEKLLRVFLSQRPAGLIVTGIDQSAEARSQLLGANCPVVQIMETGEDPVDMLIGFSHYEAAFAAASHLVEAGYRRIAFLGARMDPRTQRRLQGFSDALQEAGLYDERLVVITPRPSTVTLGCELLAELLARDATADALFCINDDLALGALFEAQRRRIAVPAELGICGFNDLEMMAASNPPITSVRTFRRAMGSKAMEMLRASIVGEAPEKPVTDLGFSLQIRQSTQRSMKTNKNRKPTSPFPD